MASSPAAPAGARVTSRNKAMKMRRERAMAELLGEAAILA
jgi:hypothetical protein